MISEACGCTQAHARILTQSCFAAFDAGHDAGTLTQASEMSLALHSKDPAEVANAVGRHWIRHMLRPYDGASSELGRARVDRLGTFLDAALLNLREACAASSMTTEQRVEIETSIVDTVISELGKGVSAHCTNQGALLASVAARYRESLAVLVPMISHKDAVIRELSASQEELRGSVMTQAKAAEEASAMYTRVCAELLETQRRLLSRGREVASLNKLLQARRAPPHRLRSSCSSMP